ncbi:hypothetical protein DFH09DRAFT_1319766 [Mycena vulgaris]|nr:hypothetical protein DFH09DRAFT_1319766 [Mycena vulgaris]
MASSSPSPLTHVVAVTVIPHHASISSGIPLPFLPSPSVSCPSSLAHPASTYVPFPASPHLNHPGVLSLHTPPLHLLPPSAFVSHRLPLLPCPRLRPRPLFLLLHTPLLLPPLPSIRPPSLPSVPTSVHGPVYVRHRRHHRTLPRIHRVLPPHQRPPPDRVPRLPPALHPPNPARSQLPPPVHPSTPLPPVRAYRIRTVFLLPPPHPAQGSRISFTHIEFPRAQVYVWNARLTIQGSRPRAAASISEVQVSNRNSRVRNAPALLKSGRIQIHTPAVANPSLDSPRLATPTLTRITSRLDSALGPSLARIQIPDAYPPFEVQVRVPSPHARNSTSPALATPNPMRLAAMSTKEP